jgi:flagellar operon protein
MSIQNSQFLSSLQIQDQYLNQKKQPLKNTTPSGLTFQEILNQKTEQTQNTSSELKFSKHAVNRLADRNIELSDAQLERLKEGTDKAGEKGINDSLVIMDQLAFIVNVPSNTVITAMDQNETKKNVFTNIDGAVIV